MKYLLSITLFALLLTSCSKKEEIEVDQAYENQQLILGDWETGRRYDIKKDDPVRTESNGLVSVSSGGSEFSRGVSYLRFTSVEDLIYKLCWDYSYDFKWSCTARMLLISGIVDGIEEFEIIVLNEDELIFEGVKTYTKSNGRTGTHTVRFEMKRHEENN